jgi:anti-anti-sigma factor
MRLLVVDSSHDRIEESNVQSHTTILQRAAAPRAALECLHRTTSAGAARVVLVGELDLATSGRARNALRRAMDGAEEVICDLRDLSFVDVRGLHVLLDAAEDARRADVCMTVVNPPYTVTRMLRILGLRSLLRRAG